MTLRYCEVCGKPIPEKKKSAKYCSAGCKSKAYRKRQGIDEPSFLTVSGNNKILNNSLEPSERKEIESIKIEIKNFEKILEAKKQEFESAHLKLINYQLGLIKIELPEIKAPKPHKKNATWDEVDKYNAEVKLYNELINNYDSLIEEEVNNQIYKPYNTISEFYKKINSEIIAREERIKRIMSFVEVRALSKDKHSIKAKDFIKMNFDTLNFKDKYLELIGKPTKNFYGMIWGDAKSGKSYFSIEFAQYLTRFGNVCYFAVEEGGGETLKNKIINLQAYDIDLEFTKNIPDIFKKAKQYDFIFIDSVTKIDLQPDELERLRLLAPKTAIIAILQSVKQGKNFKGDQQFKHNTDFIIEIERINENSTKASCEGRFGNNNITYNY